MRGDQKSRDGTVFSQQVGNERKGVSIVQAFLGSKLVSQGSSNGWVLNKHAWITLDPTMTESGH
jgi:hypothetical protein